MRHHSTDKTSILQQWITVQKSLGPIIIPSCKKIELLLISKTTIAFPNVRIIITTRWATDTTHKCVTVVKHLWYYTHVCIKISHRVHISSRTPQRSLCCEIRNAHALVSFNTVYMHCQGVRWLIELTSMLTGYLWTAIPGTSVILEWSVGFAKVLKSLYMLFLKVAYNICLISWAAKCGVVKSFPSVNGDATINGVPSHHKCNSLLISLRYVKSIVSCFSVIHCWWLHRGFWNQASNPLDFSDRF